MIIRKSWIKLDSTIKIRKFSDNEDYDQRNISQILSTPGNLI